MSGADASIEFATTHDAAPSFSLRPGGDSIDCYATLPGGAERCIARVTGRVSVGNDELVWRSESDSGRLTAAGHGLSASLLVAPGDGDALTLSLQVKRTQSKLYPHADPTTRRTRPLHRCGIWVDFLPALESGNAMRVDLDDCHVPHLVPRPGLVMADMVFRSPAIVVRARDGVARTESDFAAALWPDLDALARHRPAPWALDFERDGPLGSPRLTLEMVHTKLDHHVYFRAAPTREIAIPDDGIELSGALVLTAAAGPDFVRDVQRHLWAHYGHALYENVRPQLMPFDESAQEAMGRLFARDDLYFEFERSGKTYGGVAAHACTAKKPLRPLSSRATRIASPLHGLGISLWLDALNKFSLSRGADDFLYWSLFNLGMPYIAESQFASWFNNLRTAYGARCLAERWQDSRLIQQADLIKELALSAPTEDGIFSAVCTYPGDDLRWHKGTLSFKAIDDYHTPDQATTGYVALRWYRDIEQDPRLLEMARPGFPARTTVRFHACSSPLPQRDR
jgi:hypothetical protein